MRRERFPRHRLQRKPLVNDPGMHHCTCVTHVPRCMSGSLTRGGEGKRSRHSRRMRISQVYVSGKRPIGADPLIPANVNKQQPDGMIDRGTEGIAYLWSFCFLTHRSTSWTYYEPSVVLYISHELNRFFLDQIITRVLTFLPYKSVIMMSRVDLV